MQRKIISKLIAHLPQKEYTILVGSRQIGKSTVLQQMHAQQLANGELSFLITFEDIEILNAINQHPEKIFNYITKPNGKRIYLFLDEVQYATNPSNFLKYLYDTYGENLKVIATGSRAFYIDRKFTDSLAGRKRIFNLYTLDFEEFLIFKQKQNLVDEWLKMRNDTTYMSLKGQEIRTFFEEYIIYGGYPRVVLENNSDEKKLLLQELVNTFVKKDILESGVGDDIKFYQLFKVLASQIGNLVNQNELANTLKMAGTTVDNYLYVLQKCFHIQLVNPMYGNLRKELTKMPKVYMNDNGLRNTLLNMFQPLSERIDKGQLIENSVFGRFRDFYGMDAIKYWRTAEGHEVDFIIETSFNNGNAYEVKYNSKEMKPSKYRKFRDNYPQYPLKCVAFQAEDAEAIELLRL